MKWIRSRKRRKYSSEEYISEDGRFTISMSYGLDLWKLSDAVEKYRFEKYHTVKEAMCAAEKEVQQVQFLNWNMILKAANEKVTEYMAQGYMISQSNGGIECEGRFFFCVDLQKGNHYIRVSVERYNDWFEMHDTYGDCYERHIQGLILSVVELPADYKKYKDRKVLRTRAIG